MTKPTTSRNFLCIGLLVLTPLLVGSTGPRVNLDQRLLDAQNIERSRVGVPPLLWDAKLAADARQWAHELAAKGEFKHSDDQPGEEPEGENLWAGTPGMFSPEHMVSRWIEEKRDYRPGVFPENSRSGDVEAVGHYTQVIWRQSTHVGCAIASGSEEVLVCRYSQAGNIVGERPA